MTRLVKGTKIKGRLKGLTSGKGKKKGLVKQLKGRTTRKCAPTPDFFTGSTKKRTKQTPAGKLRADSKRRARS